MKEVIKSQEALLDFAELSRALSDQSPDIDLENLSPEDLGARIEARALPDDYFEHMDRAARKLAERGEESRGEAVIGPVFTGHNGVIFGNVYFPISNETYLEQIGTTNERPKRVKAGKVVGGTPILIAVRHPEIFQKLKEIDDQRQREELLLEAVREVSQRSIEGKSRSTVSWGGWGGTPALFHKRLQYLLLASSMKDETPLEMMVQPGFFGSSHSLSRELPISERDKLIRDSINFDMFGPQIEDFAMQFAKLIDRTKPPEDLFPDIFDLMVGHSMGGYLALLLAKQSTNLTIIEEFKRRSGNLIVADKPVIVGARYPKEKMPEWMQQIVESHGYEEHVPLQNDGFSWLVRLGTSEIWRTTHMEEIKGDILDSRVAKAMLRIVFGHYMAGGNAFDEQGLIDGHIFNFIHDPDFLRICVHLLDNVRPPLGDATRKINVGRMEILKVFFANLDRILRHQLGLGMVEILNMKEENIMYDEEGGHYASLLELLEMYCVSRSIM